MCFDFLKKREKVVFIINNKRVMFLFLGYLRVMVCENLLVIFSSNVIKYWGLLNLLCFF